MHGLCANVLVCVCARVCVHMLVCYKVTPCHVVTMPLAKCNYARDLHFIRPIYLIRLFEFAYCDDVT